MSAFATLAIAASAFANEAPTTGAAPAKKNLIELGFGQLAVTVLVFIGLALVLRKFAWGPILRGLKSREEAIRSSVEAAAKAKADAEKATIVMEEKLAAAQAEAAKQLQAAKADALKIADSIKAQAESDAAALKDRTLRDIEAAKQQALAEINARVADVGISVARKILRREVNVNDQAQLVEESLAQIAAAKR
jgi:F-type H+-transporting ATPase subunit b